MARQFNLIPAVAEQAEYHLFQRDKVEVAMPELYHKIGIPVFLFHSTDIKIIAVFFSPKMSVINTLKQIVLWSAGVTGNKIEASS